MPRFCNGPPDVKMGGGRKKFARSKTAVEEVKTKQLFDVYDYDGSGTIDYAELTELLTDLNFPISPEILKKHVDALDDGSGFKFDEDGQPKIDYEAFNELYMQIASCQSQGSRKANMGERLKVNDLQFEEMMLRHAFEMYDDDNSGYLELDEMKRIFKDLGIPDTDGDEYDRKLNEYMYEYDADGDGQFSYQEFVTYINKVAEAQDPQEEGPRY